MSDNTFVPGMTNADVTKMACKSGNIENWKGYMSYNTFVRGLTDAQVVALACQAGLENWNDYPVSKVRLHLALDSRGMEIFKRVYGEEAEV